MYSLTCFGRPDAHHQELNNCSSSLWFYRWSVVIAVLLVVVGPARPRPTALLSHRSGRQPKTYVKPEAAITVFELLMISGVSPETCWAIKKHWNNKFYYTVASYWFFLLDLHNSFKHSCCHIVFYREIWNDMFAHDISMLTFAQQNWTHLFMTQLWAYRSPRRINPMRTWQVTMMIDTLIVSMLIPGFTTSSIFIHLMFLWKYLIVLHFPY
jgi:hypothetical protein